jgi:hypothetical protein
MLSPANVTGNAKRMINYITSMLSTFTSSSDVTTNSFCIGIPILAQMFSAITYAAGTSLKCMNPVTFKPVTPSLGSRSIINKPLNHKRVTNISYILNPVPELQCCKSTFISAQNKGECNSNSNVYALYYPTVTTEIFLILVFCTVGHTVLQHLYRDEFC